VQESAALPLRPLHTAASASYIRGHNSGTHRASRADATAAEQATALHISARHVLLGQCSRELLLIPHEVIDHTARFCNPTVHLYALLLAQTAPHTTYKHRRQRAACQQQASTQQVLGMVHASTCRGPVRKICSSCTCVQQESYLGSSPTTKPSTQQSMLPNHHTPT
jgi:hypothetical protein